MRRLFPIIYTVLGLIVAARYGYLAITSVSSVLSLILAVILWPLVLLGVNLHLALGI